MEETVKTKKQPKPLLHELYDWGESMLFALVMVIVILTFIVRGTVVDGDSMLPTLRDQQFLALSRIYGSLSHNDIVVVYAPNLAADDGSGGYGKPIIKRVIGLPGDVISFDFDEGVVYRNNAALPLEYIDGFIYEDGHIINDYTFTRRGVADGAELTVPDNHIFVLGDNRNNSVDSRDKEVDMVSYNYIIGKVIFRVTPFDLFGRIL